MSKKEPVLYVDDDLINLEIFDLNFSERFDVIVADSGHKGLEVLKKNEGIKVVITDYRMPVMNGIEFITQAKAMYPKVKFSILTGFDLLEDIQRAIELGLVEHYFSKPFSYDKIEEAINSMSH